MYILLDYFSTMSTEKKTNFLLIRYEPEKQERLKLAASLTHRTVSELVREAIEDKLSKLEKRVPEFRLDKAA
jgi:predicted DNA-binding protein